MLLDKLSELQRVVCRVVVEDKEAPVGTVMLDELRHELDERLSVCVLGELPVERLVHIRADSPDDGAALAPIGGELKDNWVTWCVPHL